MPEGHMTLVIIPAHNEGEVIGSVIAEIRDHCAFPVVVIDDASADDTALVAAEAGATVVSLPVRLGAWGATQTGLRYALHYGYEIAVSMDADGQHEAAELAKVIQPVSDAIADVSIGACTRRGSLLRRIAWTVMKKVSGLSLEDITSGFRVYNQQAIRELASWRATLLEYQDVGVLLLLQSKGMRIVDIDVAMPPRRNGKSRIFHSWIMVVYYLSYTLLLGLAKRKRVANFNGSMAADLQ